MSALRFRRAVRGALVLGLVAIAPAAANGQDNGPSLREAAQLRYSQGNLASARELAVLPGDYALSSHDAAEAAAAYLDAAWIAITEVNRSNRQARHPYLAALQYGAIGRYRALDRQRAALVEEAERLVNEALQLTESAALGEAQREAILGRVEAFQEVAVAG